MGGFGLALLARSKIVKTDHVTPAYAHIHWATLAPP